MNKLKVVGLVVVVAVVMSVGIWSFYQHAHPNSADKTAKTFFSLITNGHEDEAALMMGDPRSAVAVQQRPLMQRTMVALVEQGGANFTVTGSPIPDKTYRSRWFVPYELKLDRQVSINGNLIPAGTYSNRLAVCEDSGIQQWYVDGGL
jgi:hypothetical protein